MDNITEFDKFIYRLNNLPNRLTPEEVDYLNKIEAYFDANPLFNETSCVKNSV